MSVCQQVRTIVFLFNSSLINCRRLSWKINQPYIKRWMKLSMAIISWMELLRPLKLKLKPHIFALAWRLIPIWWCCLRFSLSQWTQIITIVSIPVNNLVKLTLLPDPLMCKFSRLVSHTQLRLQLRPIFNVVMKANLVFKTLYLQRIKSTIHIAELNLRNSVIIQINFSFPQSPKSTQE